jgi:hypothetical protein
LWSDSERRLLPLQAKALPGFEKQKQSPRKVYVRVFGSADPVADLLAYLQSASPLTDDDLARFDVLAADPVQAAPADGPASSARVTAAKPPPRQTMRVGTLHDNIGVQRPVSVTDLTAACAVYPKVKRHAEP